MSEEEKKSIDALIKAATDSMPYLPMENAEKASAYALIAIAKVMRSLIND